MDGPTLLLIRGIVGVMISISWVLGCYAMIGGAVLIALGVRLRPAIVVAA